MPGRRFTNIGKALLDKLGITQSRGELLCITAEVQCMIEPLLAANEIHVEAEMAARNTGDAHW